MKCSPFDPRLSDPITQVLASVHWESLERLDLIGDIIDQWIQLLLKVDAPGLKCLQICGTKTVQQELAHSSVLFVERFLCTGALEGMYLGDVQLKDANDWVRLFESMDPSMLENFDLGGSTFEQFTATPEAMDLCRSKRTWWRREQRGDDSEGGTSDGAESDEKDSDEEDSEDKKRIAGIK